MKNNFPFGNWNCPILTFPNICSLTQPSDLLLFWNQYKDRGTYRVETITLLCPRFEWIVVSSGILRESRGIILIFRYLEVSKISITAKNINAPCSSETVHINSSLPLLTLHKGFDISIIHSQFISSACTMGYQVYHLLHLPKCYFWKGWDFWYKSVLGLGPAPAASTHPKHPQYDSTHTGIICEGMVLPSLMEQH